MLFQANESGLDNVRSEKLKNYYLHEQGIQLIWYESSFDDLPKFLHKLNEDVTQEFKAEMIVPDFGYFESFKKSRIHDCR